jgi:Glucodextranase, domain B
MQLRALAFVIGLLALGLAACGDNIHDNAAVAVPARVATSITPNPLTAGDMATVTCIVYDADDHEIDGFAPTLSISPVDPGTTIADLTAIVTKAGTYAAQCSLPDLAGDNVDFNVVHALPAALMIAKSPDQTVYGIDAAVTITHAVTDRYANPIPDADAMVLNTSTPVSGQGPIALAGLNVFTYGSEGKYHVHSQVMPPTDAGADVSADLDLVVNQNGPKITCGSPVDASELNLADGSSLTFTGTAVDVNGTMSVVVNGNPVMVDANGAFSVGITSHFGINFIDVKATDAYGVDTVKVCTFLAATQWAGYNVPYADTVSLRLGQSAIDDFARGGAINSLGDLLYTVANSTGLHDTLNASLLAANPLRPYQCDESLPFIGCIFHDQIDYLSSSLPGPNTNALSLVAGGLTVTERINQPVINLRITGTISTNGPVTFDYITVQATFDVGLSGGTPHMSIRPGSVNVAVGGVSTDFSGVAGWLISNVIVPLAQGSLKSAVASLVQSYVANNFNAVLDGVVSGLDISSLGTTFDVPRLDSGSVTLAFAPSFTSLDTSSGRMLFGIGTNLSAPAGNMYATLGAPVPAGPVLTDPNTGGQAAGVAAHVAILDQALHTLWKANYFHATIAASTLSGPHPPHASPALPGGAALPNGNAGVDDATTIDVNARLPPVASIANSVVSLALGDVDLVINSGTTSTAVTVGVRAHTDVALVGNALSFSGIVIDELHLSSDAIDLTSMQQASLQMLIQQLVQQVIDTSLNSALPSLPIPSFTLPASLAAYGLPAGAQLGITTPSLVVTAPHFVLSGGFGVQ